MSEYVVHEEWQLPRSEFPSKPGDDLSGHVTMSPGDEFGDGYFDPDVVADLLAMGVIARVGEKPAVVTVPEDKPKKSKKKAEPAPEDGVG